MSWGPWFVLFLLINVGQEGIKIVFANRHRPTFELVNMDDSQTGERIVAYPCIPPNIRQP